MHLTQHKRYPLIKKIYSICLALILSLAFIFSLVNTEPRGKLNAALNYESTYADLSIISQKTHALGTPGHAELQIWLEEQIEIAGFKVCDRDLTECDDDHISERYVLHLHKVDSGYSGSRELPFYDEVDFIGLGGDSVGSEGILIDTPNYEQISNESEVWLCFGEHDELSNKMKFYLWDGDESSLTKSIEVVSGIFRDVSAQSAWIPGGVVKSPLAITNFIATVRGEKPGGKALLISSHYDGIGGIETMPATADDGIAVASCLEVMRYAVNNPVENDVIFIISDGEETGLIGAIEYMKSFTAAGIDPADKIGLVVNFEATGTSGSLLMFETGSNEADTVKAYSKILGTVSTNSLMTWVYSVMDNYTDLKTYKENGLQGLNFACVGSGQNYHSPNDSMENLSEGLLIQTMNVMLSAYNHFGNFNFDEIKSGGNAVYFNFYTWGLIIFPVWVIYLFLGLMLCGLTAAVVFNRKNLNTKTILKILITTGIVLASVIIAVGIIYLFSLIMNAITGVWLASKFSTFGIVFAELLIGIAVMTTALYFFAKLCRITKRDVFTASAIILFILTTGLAFALPSASFLFLLPAIINVLALVLESVVKHKEANSIIKDLNLPVLSAVFAFTTAITFPILIIYALGTYLAPFIMALPLLAFTNLPLLIQNIKFGKIIRRKSKTAKEPQNNLVEN